MKRAVRKKKILYRRLLNSGTEDARQLYKEAMLEAKIRLTKFINE